MEWRKFVELKKLNEFVCVRPSARAANDLELDFFFLTRHSQTAVSSKTSEPPK